MKPLAMLALILALAVPVAAQQPPPKTSAAQDGFVPVDTPMNQETIPAARLVAIAYGFIWLKSMATSSRAHDG